MRIRILQLVALGLILAGFSASQASAQTGTRATNRQIETLLIRIETKIDVLKDEAQRFADRNTDTNVNAESLGEALTSLEQSTAKLHETFDARDPVGDDLTAALTDATQVDRFMVRNRVTPSAQSQWRSLKRDLNTLASYNRVSWNWNQPVQSTPSGPRYPATTTMSAYTVSDSQMQTLISRIGLKTGIYKSQMNTALRSDTSADLSDQEIMSYVTAFQTATDRLKQRVNDRQSTSSDATDVLTQATYIDQLMNRNRFTTQAEAQWRNLKGDLNTLASYYSLSWNWNQTLPTNTARNAGGFGVRNFDRAITGTYRLNTSLSDDPASAIDRAINSSPQTDRETGRMNLERRLRAPEMLAIEKNGTNVSLASTILPQVTFQADGVARTETNARGRTITTTTTADQDGLIINYQGERANDFYVTFLPMSDGRLKMTRRIYLDNSSDSITVSSVYDKVDTVARWSTVNTGADVTSAGAPTTVNDSYIVPSGTRLTAELRSPIAGSALNDRFTMDVTTPGQYRGATITGRVISEDPNSRVAGNTRVLLAFDTIRLPGGQTYRFGGTVDSVSSASGDYVAVNNQTPVRNASQTTRGVGGVLGALIGAIAGVPVDNTATASTVGTVLTQRGDTMDLGAGSQFTITATNPQ